MSQTRNKQETRTYKTLWSLQAICKTYHTGNNWRERNSVSLPTVILDSGHNDVLFFFFQDIFVLPVAEIPLSNIYQSQIKILPHPFMLDSVPWFKLFFFRFCWCHIHLAAVKLLLSLCILWANKISLLDSLHMHKHLGYARYKNNSYFVE